MRSLLLLLAVVPFCLKAALLETSWMNPSPTGADMYALATNSPFAATRFLMVGEGGALATNTDGVTWRFLNSGTRRNLRGVAIGPSASIVVGDGGTILRSIDSENWTPVNGQLADFRCVIYASGHFVAAGALNGQAYLATSTDGLTWTEQQTGLAAPINAVASQGSFYVAVGDQGGVSRAQGVSSWTVIPAFTQANLVSVAPGNGIYLAISDALTGNRMFASSNGTSWNTRTLPTSLNNTRLYGVGYYNLNYAVAAGEGQILTSSDTITWTPRALQPDTDGELTTVLGTSRGWNVVGKGGKIYFGLNLFGSWSRFSTGPQSTANGLASNGEFWVAVGNKGQIMGSANGTTWVNRTSNTTKTLRAVTIGSSNYWVAAGESGAVMVAAQNGDNWMARQVPIQGDFYAATSGAGRYLVGGAGGVLLTSTSFNAFDWTSVPSSTIDKITSLAYLNTTFFAGTDKGSVLHSSNGTTWVTVATGVTGSIQGLAWFQKKYWALITDTAGNSTLISSPQGNVWTTVHTQAGAHLTSLAANDSWLAALSPSGAVLSTPDGDTVWDFQPEGSGAGWQALAVVDGDFAAAGKWGKIASLTFGLDLEDYFGPLQPSSSGWYLAPWLGWFNANYYPVIYKEFQGWWSCAGPGLSQGQNSFWFYDFVLGWLWTASGTYPWVYVSDRDAWAFYDSTDGNLRWYYFTDTNQWQQVPMS